jgi:hypothetical protein
VSSSPILIKIYSLTISKFYFVGYCTRASVLRSPRSRDDGVFSFYFSVMQVANDKYSPRKGRGEQI